MFLDKVRYVLTYPYEAMRFNAVTKRLNAEAEKMEQEIAKLEKTEMADRKIVKQFREYARVLSSAMGQAMLMEKTTGCRPKLKYNEQGVPYIFVRENDVFVSRLDDVLVLHNSTGD